RRVDRHGAAADRELPAQSPQSGHLCAVAAAAARGRDAGVSRRVRGRCDAEQHDGGTPHTMKDLNPMNLVRLIPTAGIRRRLRGAIAAMVSAAVAAAVSIVLSAPAAAADLSDHTLGAGDLLKISVFGYPDLTQEARISQTGRISYPLIGEVGVGEIG